MDVALLAVLVFLAQAPAASIPTGGCSNDALVGTWRMTKGTFGGQAIPLGPTDPVPMKQVTPTHFVMFTYEPAKKTFLYAHGGPFTATGDTYEESVEYGFGDSFAAVGGSKPRFKCHLANDTWRVSGQLADGTALEETWTRAPKP
jgi:hypothetical protein